jgi:hypothetical protein
MESKAIHSTFLPTVFLSIIPAFLVLLFAYTGTAKLSGHELFISQLLKTELLKNNAEIISVGLPIIELLTALLLCFRSSRQIGLWFSILLMTAFSCYVIIVLSGNNKPCSCGGVMAFMSWTQHLYFNIFFLTAAIAALCYHKIISRVNGGS